MDDTAMWDSPGVRGFSHYPNSKQDISSIVLNCPMGYQCNLNTWLSGTGIIYQLSNSSRCGKIIQQLLFEKAICVVALIEFRKKYFCKI